MINTPLFKFEIEKTQSFLKDIPQILSNDLNWKSFQSLDNSDLNYSYCIDLLKNNKDFFLNNSAIYKAENTYVKYFEHKRVYEIQFISSSILNPEKENNYFTYKIYSEYLRQYA